MSERPRRNGTHSGGDGKKETEAIEYLVVGHVTVDRLEGQARLLLGGLATYASLTVRNMGGRVGVHTSAGYEPGLVDTLYGTLVARVPAEYTTCFVNRYTEGVRQQSIESVAEKLTYDQILPEWRNPAVVHLGPVCQELDSSMVERFPRSMIGISVQGWLRRWDEAGVVSRGEWPDAERVLPRAHAVFVSEEDLQDDATRERWRELSRLLVVTRGSQGCDVYSQGSAEAYHSAPFKPTRPVDPTGAGDVFAAAFLWHLHRTGDPQQAADWANCVASFAVEKRGPTAVPKLEDVEQRWRNGKRIR